MPAVTLQAAVAVKTHPAFGLDRPVQIVQLSAKDNQLVNMAALAAFNVSG